MLKNVDEEKASFSFRSVSDTEDIAAGQPFLVKMTETVSNPVFHNIGVKSLSGEELVAEQSTDSYKFVGILSQTQLATDGTQLFLQQSGNLASPSAEGNTINGLLAFFQIPKGEPARVAINGSEANAIAVPQADSSTPRQPAYDLSGRRHDANASLAPGIYVRGGKKLVVR